jgi:D-glycero-D-manno-heptose 1,7-bisphosphate phosphatase
MRRAVFLDRDGVINHNEVRDGRPVGPRSVERFVLLPGVREAIEILRAAGYLVIVATNQPDVAHDVIEAMHAKMRHVLALDDVRVCTHTDADNCACRKPKPGLLLDAARAHGIALAESWMVGDRWRDVEAGKAAGCRTVFIDHGYANEPRPRSPDAIVASLMEAVPVILGKK